jgi:hypothetical protein
MWFAGVDGADSHHDVVVIDEMSRQVGSCPVTHTVEGLKQLNDFLLSMSGADRKEEMACIMESLSSVSRSLVFFIWNPDFLPRPVRDARG